MQHGLDGGGGASDGEKEQPASRRSPPSPAAACCASLPSYRRRRGLPKGSTVASFPDGILLEILSCLPAKPLFRFKCVSKAWSGLIAECLRNRKTPLTLQGFFYLDDSSYTDLHFVNLLGRSVPPVDPSFSFLTKLPGIESIILLHCCNGLMLFWNRRYFNEDDKQTLGYIVCNPATKEWVDVPFSGCTWAEEEMLEDWEMEYTHTYLIFDPAVSSKFELVQFCGLNMLQVYTYSSESGVWSKRATECWSHETLSLWRSAFVNGMQHLTVKRRYEYRTRIVAFNEKGDKCRTMHWPEEERGLIAFLGQSQGHLYCMSGHAFQLDRMFELSIWVLEDYDTEQWILKDSVSCVQLFGEVNYSFRHSPITIHPDYNLVFFASISDDKLISYNMDTKEVNVLSTLEHGADAIKPYTPYLRESSVFTKH
ncbi:hypothetical protein BS78_02G060500 [Paspalum vaginatum]|nr:hypothetical protein BS78_02G060500 [Paspalum vaginatum]